MSSVLKREPRPRMPRQLYNYIYSIEEDIKKANPGYVINDPNHISHLPPDADETMKAMLNDYNYNYGKWVRNESMLRNPHVYAKLMENRKTASSNSHSSKNGGKQKLNKRARRTARK
jgi:hypothetical protein